MELNAPGYTRILRLSWPIILANAAVPLLGLTDTAVIGNWGTIPELGAIALGALIFNFIYWIFGFLRMGTTGLIAQAVGAGDEAEVRATLARALLTGGGIGAALIVLQLPVFWFAFWLLSGSEEVESIGRGYALIRIWGAPASLALFALMGVLIGLGRSGLLLRIQLLLNGLNIVLDVLFAGVLHWGANGIALGTALSEWITCAVAMLLVYRLLRKRHRGGEPFIAWRDVLDRIALVRMLRVNTDIMIRTLMLQLVFAWFMNQSAQFSDDVLAANHILLLLIGFAAYFLDGYAFATESLVGMAKGTARRDVFDTVVHRSTVLAASTALLLAALMFAAGTPLIELLTNLEPARQAAVRFLPYAVFYTLVSFAAFQLDGIFIGTTRTSQMRDASVISAVVFFLAWWLLTGSGGNAGLWVALTIHVLARALTLAMYYPGLRRTIGGTQTR